jgi:capsular polysaccharide biosynthesis protein
MQFFKKQISTFYKTLVREFFKICHGKIYFSKHKKYNQNIKIYEVKNKNIKKNDNTNYKIFEIKNGRIYNDHVQNVACISNNRIINEISYQQIEGNLKSAKFNSVINNGTPYIKKKIKGNVLNLSQGASGHSNYFHWLVDILPKIKIFSEKFSSKDLNYLYLPKLKQFQKISLNLLGYGKIKILDSKRFRHIEADILYAIEHPWYFKGYVHKENYHLPKWIVQWLRSKFLPLKKKIKSKKNIFIDRSESKYSHMQFINNREIIEFFRKKNFMPYKVGKLSFQKQIYLFFNSNIIIGGHGAAFTNLIFCKPNTKIIEIKTKNHPSLVNKRISYINNLRYNLIKISKIKNSKNNGDMYINPEQIYKFIKK